MDIVERVREIILQPKKAWENIRKENITLRELYVSYAAILSLIPAAAYFIGMSFVGIALPGSLYRVPVISGFTYAVLQFVLTLVGMYAAAYIVTLLSDRFSSRKDMVAATKVAVYSWTPALLSGVFAIYPPLSPLILLGSLYSLYLFYTGLPLLMETPKEKSVGYFIVVLALSFLIWIALSAVASLSVRLPLPGISS